MGTGCMFSPSRPNVAQLSRGNRAASYSRKEESNRWHTIASSCPVALFNWLYSCGDHWHAQILCRGWSCGRGSAEARRRMDQSRPVAHHIMVEALCERRTMVIKDNGEEQAW